MPLTKLSTAGIIIVATANAAALPVSSQPNELVPILLVPTPQKNMEGKASTCRHGVTLMA